MPLSCREGEELEDLTQADPTPKDAASSGRATAADTTGILRLDKGTLQRSGGRERTPQRDESASPGRTNRTPVDDVQRQMRRREGNRKAAARLRLRRQAEVQALQSRVQQYEQEIDMLQSSSQNYLGQVRQLSSCCERILLENQLLRQQLQMHQGQMGLQVMSGQQLRVNTATHLVQGSAHPGPSLQPHMPSFAGMPPHVYP